MNLPKDVPVAAPPQRLLGEFLCTAGLLSSEQLNEAIEYQCIYGGKLGTSLIELGLIDENTLAKALSKQLKHHYVKPQSLMNVTSSVLKFISKQTALKYQVVPYYNEGKKLFVALNEMTRANDIDELSSLLDLTIIPLAIPEVRIMLALKKHYGMQIPPRYETIEGQIKRRKQAAHKVDQRQNLSKDQSQTPLHAQSNPEPMAMDPSAWPLLGDIPLPVEEDPDKLYFDNLTQEKEMATDSLFQKLANPHDREDIAKAILLHLQGSFSECALLMVRQETATGWLASVEKGIQQFEQIVISLQSHSVFSLVATNQTYYLGPMQDSQDNRIMLDFFATQLPQNVLVLPITLKNRLVSLLYIQGDLAMLEKQLPHLQQIVDKAEMSFRLLILKNKILQT